MRRLSVTMATALAPLVWGTTYLVTTQFLPSDAPLFAALMRALPAGLLALALSRTLPRGSWWWRAAVLGVLNIGAFFPLLFVAAYRLPGGLAATLGAGQPLIVAVLAVVLLGQAWSAWRLGWGVIGVLGVALVVLRADAVPDLLGVVAGLAGAASMGLGVTLTKRWGRPTGALAFAGWQLTAGGLALLPLTLIVEGVPTGIDATAVAGYAWLGLVGGLLAYTLWFTGIGRIPVTSAAMLALLSPVVAAALGALVLGERFEPAQLLGFALALCAIVAGQLRAGAAEPPAATGPQNVPTAALPVEPLAAVGAPVHPGTGPVRLGVGTERPAEADSGQACR
ncbi:EamA family transporter [Occultella aeris]|uniref:Putative amino-acid metabolite efflux pump n=1 Tax=Occultella aeris TaxID=2761496 RepID=A0A7M4DMT8_9MICO|nr:EamA family transporter [Occultella aeris]VZO38733.1 putative amino-acid metabolite efflux pump [Occultella aeris]